MHPLLFFSKPCPVRLIFGLFIEGLTPCAIAQRSAKGERLRREASPFRGRCLSGRLRRRERLQAQKRRILRLTTPTGAALVHTLATYEENMPKDFRVERIAYGAGFWDLTIPNVLRVYLGEMA